MKQCYARNFESAAMGTCLVLFVIGIILMLYKGPDFEKDRKIERLESLCNDYCLLSERHKTGKSEVERKLIRAEATIATLRNHRKRAKDRQ
jgi:hypothetical protein